MNDLTAKAEKLQGEVQDRIDALHLVNQMLKKQAMRMLELKNIFVTKGEHKIVQKLSLNEKMTEYDEYKQLISKQICGKSELILKAVTEIKTKLSKLSSELKAGKAENGAQSLKEFYKKISNIDDSFHEVWKEGSYLMCNYRMDITAK